MSNSLEVRRVRVPFRAPLATASGTWASRDAWLLRLAALDGRTGWGEVVLEDPADGPRLERLLAEAVAMWRTGEMPSARTLAAAGGPGLALRAALEAAVIDMERTPSRLLLPGGSGVGVNAVIGASGADVASAAARTAVADGFRTLKLKAGVDDTTDRLVARVGAVRAAVGARVALRLDVNAAWGLGTAIERINALEEFGLQYVEQPMDEPMAGLRRRVRVPIAADEAVLDTGAARALLSAGGADVLVVKLARVGGPFATAAIAAMAADHGVPVVISSLFETGLGLAAAAASAAALPDVPGWPAAERDHGLATAHLLEHDLLKAPLLIAGGRLHVPAGAGTGGLGVRVDEAAIRRYEVEA